MKFKLNDWVVYPGHGVGQITRDETKEIFGKTQQFFTIEISTSNMKMLVPSDNVRQVGLRKILSKNQINKVFEEVKSIPVIRENRWEKRYRVYMEQIKTGQFIDIVTVLKQLTGNKEDFDLSFGERKMLETAKELVTEEVSLAWNVHREKAEEIITEKLR
jgi:CarD family transcriptional regulator